MTAMMIIANMMAMTLRTEMTMSMTMMTDDDDGDAGGDDQSETDMVSVNGVFCSNAVRGSDPYPIIMIIVRVITIAIIVKMMIIISVPRSIFGQLGLGGSSEFLVFTGKVLMPCFASGALSSL